MTVLHSGSTKKFADGWDNIFAGGSRKSSARKKAKPAKATASPKKKAAPKRAAKKKARR